MPPPITSKYTGEGAPVLGGAGPASQPYQLPGILAPISPLRGAANARSSDRKGRAAMEVAAALGKSFETAVTPWCPEDSAHFTEGLEVRIVGLDTEPTWDGAEGEIESYDAGSGMVRIAFEDGRTKSVHRNNCEPAARMPRKQASGSNKAAPRAERAGHGGRIAKPQGSVSSTPPRIF